MRHYAHAETLEKNLESTKVTWRQLFYMTKPGVTLLVVVTVIPGMLLALRAFPDPLVAIGALVGTALAAASAAIFNQIIDTKIDGRMQRTRLRPLVRQDLSPFTAAAYGAFLAALGLGLLCWLSTPLASLIAFLANVFYVLVYSVILKKRTAQNIVIGGAAGAIGPLIGWAAVTGTIGLPAWLLFLLIFLWTPPHFWALAIKYKDDYAQAGVPMLPVVRGEAVTRRHIFLYTLTLLPPVIALYYLGSVSLFCEGLLVAATAIFIWKAFRLYRSGESLLAMDVFHYSCLYLFAIFGFITFDQIWTII